MYNFDDFWRDYDKKTGKDKCITKWMLLTSAEHLKIEIHVPGFVSSKRNKQYRPNPLSYLNGKMWLDENVKDEDKILLSKPKVQKISTYQPPRFDPEEGKAFIIKKIRLAYEGKCTLNDVGSVYTSRLKPFLECDPMLLDMIKKEVQEIVDYVPSNRFEEKIEINVELEVRNRILKYNMDRFREVNREIWKEL